MIFTQKSMTKHLKFYQQRGPGRAGEHAGTSGCRSPWSCSPPPPPPPSPGCREGDGRGPHAGICCPVSPPSQLLSASSLGPACPGERGSWCLCRVTSPFAGVGLRPREGRPREGRTLETLTGHLGKRGVRPWPGVGELAAASSGSDWSSLGQGVRLRTEGSGGLRAQPSTLQRDVGRLAGRVRARCGEGASGLKAGLQVGHRRVGGLENWEEGVS